MRNHLFYILFILAIITLSGRAYAQVNYKPLGASEVATKNQDAVVVELFTSQGCSSCPPADAYLRELASDPDVLTFEYHVDYWNSDNGWTDRFSKQEWTERQSLYNRTVFDTERVYTPQMVIDGRFQGVGSEKNAIRELIKQAHARRGQPIMIAPHVIDDKKLLVSVRGGGTNKDISVILVRFLRNGEAKVTGGENKGRKMTGYNIVTSATTIGTWAGGRSSYKTSMAPLAENESCAVLLQDPDSLRILSGRFCGL